MNTLPVGINDCNIMNGPGLLSCPVCAEFVFTFSPAVPKSKVLTIVPKGLTIAREHLHPGTLKYNGRSKMKRNTFLLLACVVCLGCRSRGGVQQHAQAPGAQAPGASVEVAGNSVQAEPEEEVPVWKRALRLVGFESPAPVTPEQQWSELEDLAQEISERSSALDPSDSHRVTRRKAQRLFSVLGRWESAKKALQSNGLHDDATATQLDGMVKHLRSESRKLVRSKPTPKSIASIRKWGTALHSNIDDISPSYSDAVEIVDEVDVADHADEYVEVASEYVPVENEASESEATQAESGIESSDVQALLLELSK